MIYSEEKLDCFPATKRNILEIEYDKIRFRLKI